jgi:hypothetical protein
MDARAAKPIALATNYVRPASIAGATVIVGGTKTAVAGAPSATGMTTTMIATIEIVTAIARHVKPQHPLFVIPSRRRSVSTAPFFR